MAEHTPGPWLLGDATKNENPLMVYCDDSLGSRIADCSTSGHGITNDQDAANARLIAAAPDLLALSRQYLSECGECLGIGRTTNPEFGQGEVDCPQCEDIRAVIAKATLPRIDSETTR